MKKHILSLSFILMGLQVGSVRVEAKSLPLQDPPYRFDSAKLDAAEDAFHFLRSYVDYFYLLIQANQNTLQTVQYLRSTPGWCVGDAHPENFGILLQQDGRPMFTMNDMDDSGPCPIGLDLIRLMVSSRLYDSDVKLEKIMSAYIAGLQQQSYETPAALTDMVKKALKKGTDPSPKKVDGKKIIRDDNMREVTSKELSDIKAALSALRSALSPQTKVLDVVATSKIGGGSGGLLRYEVLLDNAGTLLHLELKEEITPSIYPVATQAIPDTATRIQNTMQVDQSGNPSVYYTVVQVSGKDMLVRPRFDGNIGVDLDKQSDSDNLEIISYEAYTLGRIHTRSITGTKSWIQTLQGVKSSALEQDVTLLVQQFKAKYSSLK